MDLNEKCTGNIWWETWGNMDGNNNCKLDTILYVFWDIILYYILYKATPFILLLSKL